MGWDIFAAIFNSIYLNYIVNMFMHAKKAIGILGGVGPEAGVCLEHYILEETRKQNKPQSDQDHIPTFHLSCPDLISDRSAYLSLKNLSAQNPAEGAIEVMALFEVMAEHQDEDLYVGIPCNTFHARKIFQELESLMSQKNFEHLHLINMIEETGRAIQDNFSHMHKIGLLSTIGTREAKIYHDILLPMGFEIIEVPDLDQERVHDTIYNPNWGIKSGMHDKSKTRKNMLAFAINLIQQGAQSIILGCTEIPLVLPESHINNIPLIDPMRILAEKLVQEASQ